MHRQPPRRKVALQRTVVYTLMTIVVVTATTVLFFLLMGYRFNADEGEFQQGGLAQFVTRPTGATVTVGRAHLAAKTPSKITLNPGSYEVRMELEGYRPWHKTVSIASGQVLWLNSTRFVPLNPKTEVVDELRGFGSMTARSKGNKVLIVEDKARAELSVFDISGTTVTQAMVAIPSAAYTQGTKHTFTLESMSRNDRYAVVRHTYDKKTERIVVDVREPRRSFVVESASGGGFAKVTFDPRSPGHVYGLTAKGDVHRVDLGAQTAGQRLLSGVADISFADDELLLFVGTRTAGSVKTGAMRLSDGTVYRIESIKTTAAETVRLAGGYYYGKFYIATTVGKKQTISLVKELTAQETPENQTVVSSVVLPKAPQHLSSQTKGRFFLAEHAGWFGLYDVELKKHTLSTVAGARGSTSPVEWLDEYHYWYAADGRLQFSEFDGSNIHDIAGVVPTSRAVMSTSGRYVYSVALDGKTYALQRTVLIVD